MIRYEKIPEFLRASLPDYTPDKYIPEETIFIGTEEEMKKRMIDKMAENGSDGKIKVGMGENTQGAISGEAFKKLLDACGGDIQEALKRAMFSGLIDKVANETEEEDD